jgi:hypothetical protein
MNELRKGFDWLAFFVRVVVIASLTTWFLIERLGRHDRIGVALVICIGYVIMPVVAYLHTRYYNSELLVWVVGAVKGIGGWRRRKHREHSGCRTLRF